MSISEDISEEFRGCGVPEHQLVRIFNGTDVGLNRPVESGESAELRERFGLPGDKTLVVYTGKLIGQITMPYPGTPQDAVSLSRLHLQRIRSSANSALQTTGLDDVTNAHLMETVARIDRALDAQRSTDF